MTLPAETVEAAASAGGVDGCIGACRPGSPTSDSRGEGGGLGLAAVEGVSYVLGGVQGVDRVCLKLGWGFDGCLDSADINGGACFSETLLGGRAPGGYRFDRFGLDECSLGLGHLYPFDVDHIFFNNVLFYLLYQNDRTDQMKQEGDHQRLPVCSFVDDLAHGASGTE